MEQNVILATAGYDRTVRLWDCETESTYRTLQFSDHTQVNDLAFSPDNELLLVAGYPRAHVFNVSSSTPSASYVFDTHRGNVTGIGCHPEGLWMFSSSDDGTVKTWDPRSRETQQSFNHYSPVNCITIHPRGNFLYSGDQLGRLRVWDVTAGKMIKEMQPQSTESIESLAISPDGKTIAAANYVGACFLWSLENDEIAFEPICRHQAHHRHILKIAFDHLEIPTFAAALDDGSVKLWKADRGKVDTEGELPFVAALQHHTRWVWDIAFTSDSRRIFSASSDMKALLTDVETGNVLKKFEGHQKAVTCLSIAEVAA